MIDSPLKTLLKSAAEARHGSIVPCTNIRGIPLSWDYCYTEDATRAFFYYNTASGTHLIVADKNTNTIFLHKTLFFLHFYPNMCILLLLKLVTIK